MKREELLIKLNKYIQDEDMPDVEPLIDTYTTQERIEEAKHRYSYLILAEPDEFKWKEYTEKRIQELSTTPQETSNPCNCIYNDGACKEHENG
jgi:uncharacterized secreted protein with C-terminal beta-propeller domain